MTADETARFIESDQDGYVKSMSPTDLYARKASSFEKYIDRCKNKAIDFSSSQKVRYSKACAEADDFFSKCNMPFSNNKMVQIPWVFALTEGDVYEDGLPHTRGNVIFVSSFINEQPKELIRTLIHEKIHLYQRMYPEELSHVLANYGFKQWKLRMGTPRIRANPDIDPWIYINRDNNDPMMALYSSDNPINISDIYLADTAFEHPYEYLAYEIASKYA